MKYQIFFIDIFLTIIFFFCRPSFASLPWSRPPPPSCSATEWATVVDRPPTSLSPSPTRVRSGATPSPRPSVLPSPPLAPLIPWLTLLRPVSPPTSDRLVELATLELPTLELATLLLDPLTTLPPLPTPCTTLPPLTMPPLLCTPCTTLPLPTTLPLLSTLPLTLPPLPTPLRSPLTPTTTPLL